MTPDLGQGAGQAIEDAVTLVAAVSSHQVVSTALSIYNRDRRPRTQAIAAKS